MLPEGAAIEGHVTDENGDPFYGARVEVEELVYLRGQRSASQIASGTTDDEGYFRIWGLPPGTFYIKGVALERGAAAAEPPYLPTYFGHGTSLAHAEPIEVSVGAERTDVEIRLARGRPARVSGVIEGFSGADVRISLISVVRGAGGSRQAARSVTYTSPRGDGTFEFTGIAPGDYLLAAGALTADAATVAIRVVSGDVTDVVLRPGHPAVRLRGTVATNENRLPPFSPSLLTVTLAADRDAPAEGIVGEVLPSPVRHDWTFDAPLEVGRHLISVVGLPEPWMVASIHHGSIDVTDRGVAFDDAAAAPIRVTLSRQGAHFEGIVRDERGEGVADVLVVVFSARDAFWGPGRRHVKVVRTDEEGRFTAAGLPGGSYLLTPLPFVAAGQWESREFLRTLVSTASRHELPSHGVARAELSMRIGR